jgi:hypothetical protein
MVECETVPFTNWDECVLTLTVLHFRRHLRSRLWRSVWMFEILNLSPLDQHHL